MIVAVRQGDLFDADVEALVNTVNTVGVMGKGIALQFRQRFPDMFDDYQRRCARGEVELGRPYLFRRLVPPHIVNFPTKDHWRSVSRLETIERGLRFLAEHLPQWEVSSLAVPPLGCGQGELEWSVVGPTLYRHLDAVSASAVLYAPHDVPPEQASTEFLATASVSTEAAMTKRIDPAWVAVAEIVDRVHRAVYAWPMGRTRFHKLVYFATAAGIPTGMEFRRASYGPFADDLKRTLTRLVNNGLLEERRRERLIEVTAGSTFSDAAVRFGSTIASYQQAIDSVADLMRRLDGRRTELAATVHYCAQQLVREQTATPSECDVLGQVQQWKLRRSPGFTTVEIAEMVRDLSMLGWIVVEPSDDLPVDDEIVSVA